MRCSKEGAYCHECPLEGLECFPFQAPGRPSAGVGGVFVSDDVEEWLEDDREVFVIGCGRQGALCHECPLSDECSIFQAPGRPSARDA